MTDTNKLLNKAKQGFKTLKLSNKYSVSALKNLKKWLTLPEFKEYAYQIEYLISSEKWDFLLDAFYQIIPFGTGGRRGLVGIGPNRINKWTIQASAQGHSQYLLKKHGEEARKKGIVLTYDVREYTQKGIYDDSAPNPVMNLNCKDLAVAAAEVYAANGFKVYMYDGVRSTPQLSFSIRYLKAISGDMFSASHNPPTDNGKKVYDQFGGQLIPPHDQELVDEVTNNIKEIKTIKFEDAKNKGMVKMIGKEVDETYWETVRKVSLSNARDVKIVYSPLHGTGLTSLYPVLQRAGFKVELDPKTSNMSGAFENVTFNIPNPEVRESFDNSLPYAKQTDSDILLSSDPDADRIGVMVKHNGKWEYLDGNEIGEILTEYGITKFKEKKLLNSNSIIVKTEVTSSLTEAIAKHHGVKCIGNLLVGFKYVGDVMNKLEKEGKIKEMILGAEESHGFIIGNYSRDKDSACAAVWLCELAAELKKDGKTLIDYLNKIYARHGFCINYLTEIRLLGAKGHEQIEQIQTHLRKTKITKFDEFEVTKKEDRWKGKPQPHLSETDTVSRNVLVFKFKKYKDAESLKVTVRPSGTEPKIKMYFEILGKPAGEKATRAEKEEFKKIKDSLERSFMNYCYRIIDKDFPERGYMLFWELPLEDKIKYFKIEEEIAGLKDIKDKEERKRNLYGLLKFLGANPIEKVDRAFEERYTQGIKEYLEME